MTEAEVETIIQRARERFPDARPRIISDNGPQFIAKDFKEFIRICGMTHVRTSPYYPQSNGKMERWYKTLKGDCIRVKTPLSLDDSRRIVAEFVAHYNEVRLHSAIGYVAPADKLAGREQVIFAERDRKLDTATEKRRAAREASQAGFSDTHLPRFSDTHLPGVFRFSDTHLPRVSVSQAPNFPGFQVFRHPSSGGFSQPGTQLPRFSRLSRTPRIRDEIVGVWIPSMDPAHQVRDRKRRLPDCHRCGWAAGRNALSSRHPCFSRTNRTAWPSPSSGAGGRPASRSVHGRAKTSAGRSGRPSRAFHAVARSGWFHAS